MTFAWVIHIHHADLMLCPVVVDRTVCVIPRNSQQFYHKDCAVCFVLSFTVAHHQQAIAHARHEAQQRRMHALRRRPQLTPNGSLDHQMPGEARSLIVQVVCNRPPTVQAVLCPSNGSPWVSEKCTSKEEMRHELDRQESSRCHSSRSAVRRGARGGACAAEAELQQVLEGQACCMSVCVMCAAAAEVQQML